MDYLTGPEVCQRVFKNIFRPPRCGESRLEFYSVLAMHIAQHGHSPPNCFVLRISSGTANRSTMAYPWSSANFAAVFVQDVRRLHPGGFASRFHFRAARRQASGHNAFDTSRGLSMIGLTCLDAPTAAQLSTPLVGLVPRAASPSREKPNGSAP